MSSALLTRKPSCEEHRPAGKCHLPLGLAKIFFTGTLLTSQDTSPESQKSSWRKRFYHFVVTEVTPDIDLCRISEPYNKLSWIFCAPNPHIVPIYSTRNMECCFIDSSLKQIFFYLPISDFLRIICQEKLPLS